MSASGRNDVNSVPGVPVEPPLPRSALRDAAPVLLVGTGLLAATLVIGDAGAGAASAHGLAVGAVAAVLALASRLGPGRYWVVALVGAYLVFAPVLFGYGEVRAALLVHVLAGGLLAGFGFAAAPKSREAAPPRRRARCHP